jgi:predicted acylesterase/phospholipase RssA
VFVQALVELEAAGALTDVREYWGTSAGAFLALILAVGISPATIQPILQSTQFHKFRDMDIRNLLSFQTTWGLDDGESLTTELTRIVSLLTSSTITLKDIPSLSVVVTDVNDRETRVLNGKTHPTLRAVDAVRASMSLPFFYRPYRDLTSGHYWIDGALRANFAWDLLRSDEEREATLGFCFSKPDTTPDTMTLLQYMFSMIHFDEPRKLARWRSAWSHRILWFEQPPFPAWYTRIDAEDLALLNEAGRRTAQAWLSRTTHTAPSRIQEIPPSSAPPRNRPSQIRQDSTAESSGILGYSASQLRECPSLPAFGSARLSRRWSV